jgi:hypothetical protein
MVSALAPPFAIFQRGDVGEMMIRVPGVDLLLESVHARWVSLCHAVGHVVDDLAHVHPPGR